MMRLNEGLSVSIPLIIYPAVGRHLSRLKHRVCYRRRAGGRRIPVEIRGQEARQEVIESLRDEALDEAML